ncbi:ATPase [Aureococcus anophagefferens]|uniref:ATPase n=1 Tax=Aureococcus anophagefferens TaxID=44056 RepID=A0ABR1GB07_AURAN
MGKYALVDEESPEEEGLIPETRLEVSGMQYAVGEKVLLEEVSVVFQPRHLTALMGPSGAGKTTLMNVISGARGGKILKGGVLRNAARPATPKKLRLLMSYMPQEDVLYPSLTVKQTLYYSSFLRCPEKWSREAKTERGVILSKLNLKHVENGIVGDHTTKGSISGGQKRRLSAAIEFLSFRPVMLMGEPAPGLDFAGAMTLVKLLHDAATDQGRTSENPADHALYVLARGDTDGWHAKWKAASKPAPAETVPFEDDEREDSEQDYPISFMTQYRLLLLRSVHIWVCDPSQGPLVWGMTVFSTIMYASAYFSLHDSVSRELAIITFVMFIYQAASTPLCVVMPLERAVVLRDYRNGVFSTAPYWLARADARNAMIPFKFFVMTTLLMSCCMLLGLIIGISSPSALAAIKIDAAVARLPAPDVPGREGRAAASPLTEALLEEPGGGDYGSTEEPKLCASRLDAKPVSLRAHAITLWRGVHSADKKATLHDVSVSFEAKTTTALMGPSGAGKTTLIDVLTGRTLENDLVEGVVHVNGRASCPRPTSRRERARAGEVIAQLGLQAKADVVVGSTEKPGISGGQKKRVSIGMDLLANCSVMCLDEPTTGLGAVGGALSIADVVMSLAKVTGRTMVCTIHQPTWELISRFDQLTILEDGDTMWTDLWKSCAMGKAAQTRTLAGLADASAPSPVEALAPGDELLAKYLGRYPTPFLTQYWILLKRCTLSYLKDEDQSVEHVMPSLMQSVVTGLIYLNFSPANLYLATGVCFGVMGACMIAFNAFLLNIPFEKALIVREYKNGSYGAFAYWASRLTLASVSSACVAFVTPFIWWPLMGLPLNEPSRLFYTALATSITAASYASLASLAGLVMPDAVAAAQTAEPIITLLTLTGGTMLIRPQIKVYWMWLYYLNPLHYCYEIVVTQSFQGRHGSHKPQETLDYFHYSNGHMGANFTWLITIYIVIAAVGFIVVPRTFRH